MEWLESFKDINYLGVLAAIASTFAVGMIWYAESVFGKKWMKLEGLKKKDLEDSKGMMRAMMHSTVASFFSAIVLAALMFSTSTEGVVDGAIFGAVVGFGVAMAAMVTHDAFSKKPTMLTKINGLHDVVSFAVMGAILGGIA